MIRTPLMDKMNTCTHSFCDILLSANMVVLQSQSDKQSTYSNCYRGEMQVPKT